MYSKRTQFATIKPCVNVVYATPEHTLPWVVHSPISAPPTIFSDVDAVAPASESLSWEAASKLLDDSYLDRWADDGGLCETDACDENV